MRSHGVRDYELAYNAAGILEHDAPPEALIRSASEAQVIAASDLSRAIASAERLAPGREVMVSPLLREIDLEPPHWIPLRLPIGVWDGFSYLQWSYRLLARRDHEYVRRADEAAGWLIARAGRSETVLAVTHGGFRRIVAQRLAVKGWMPAAGRRSYANWSVWSYDSP